jgi:hypothetical protein
MVFAGLAAHPSRGFVLAAEQHRECQGRVEEEPVWIMWGQTPSMLDAANGLLMLS